MSYRHFLVTLPVELPPKHPMFKNLPNNISMGGFRKVGPQFFYQTVLIHRSQKHIKMLMKKFGGEVLSQWDEDRRPMHASEHFANKNWMQCLHALTWECDLAERLGIRPKGSSIQDTGLLHEFIHNLVFWKDLPASTGVRYTGSIGLTTVGELHAYLLGAMMELEKELPI